MTSRPSRFRVERCAAHGIAIGMCTIGTCRDATKAKGVGRQLAGVIKPPRCSSCKQERGDAIKRGEFFGAKGSHPGWQRSWCDACWENKLARDKAAAAPKTQVDIELAARKRDQRERRERAAAASEAAGSFE